MNTHARSPINDLAFSLASPQASIDQVLNKHPYAVDRTQDRYALWKEFSLAHIEHTAVHNPALLEAEIGELFEGVHAYTRANNLIPAKHEKEMLQEQRDLLNTILGRLQAMTPAPAINGTMVFLSAVMSMWSVSNKKSLNNLWPVLEQHGHTIDPNTPQFHHIWEEVIMHGKTHEAQWLIDRGLLPTWRGKHSLYATEKQANDETTVLHLVNNKQTFDVVRLLPDAHVKPWVHQANEKGETPLHHAAKQLIPELVEWLMALGANPQAVTARGEYPIDMIKRTKTRVDAVSAVLELLGKQTSKTPEELFVQACQSRDISMAQMALDNGADVLVLSQNPELLKMVFAPLSMSGIKKARTRQAEFMQFLLDNNIELLNAQQQNPLHEAVKSGAVQCVSILLEARPEYAQQLDQEGRRPAQLFTKHVEIETSESKFVPQERKTMLAKTQMSMFKQFLAKKLVQPGDFPNLHGDAVYLSQMSKLGLEDEVDAPGIAVPRKKM